MPTLEELEKQLEDIQAAIEEAKKLFIQEKHFLLRHVLKG